MSNNINIGDVVHLTGGSLPLTVIDMRGDGTALVSYLGVLFETYPLAALVSVVSQVQQDTATSGAGGAVGTRNV